MMMMMIVFRNDKCNDDTALFAALLKEVIKRQYMKSSVRLIGHRFWRTPEYFINSRLRLPSTFNINLIDLRSLASSMNILSAEKKIGL